MKILMTAFGSHGDILPLLGLGQTLQARGHRVVLIVAGRYAPLVAQAGLEFVELISTEQDDEWTRKHCNWGEPIREKSYLEDVIFRLMRITHDRIEKHYEPGDTIVMSTMIMFGARIASEHLTVPLVSICLSYTALTSAYIKRCLPIPFTHQPIWLPPVIQRGLFRVIDRLTDRMLTPGINSYRRRFGLPPARRIVSEWIQSPDSILGFFPEWFVARPPDWPRQLRLCGFARYDDVGDATVPPELQSFLDEGPPPIVFTPGMWTLQGQDFFEASLEACHRLDRRGLFVARSREQVPARLPKNFAHFSYVPYSYLLPRAAAIVHHGGVGTLAQALAAGIPQVVVPSAFDQYDNAGRLKNLGVAETIQPRRYRTRRVVRVLEHLLGSEQVASRCQYFSRNFSDECPFEMASDVVEELARQKGVLSDCYPVSPEQEPKIL